MARIKRRVKKKRQNPANKGATPAPHVHGDAAAAAPSNAVNPLRDFSAAKRQADFRKKFTAKEKKVVVAASERREAKYARQQARKKQEWRAAIEEAEAERRAVDEKKRREDARLHATRIKALEHKRAVDEKREEEEAVARERLRAKTAAYEQRLRDHAKAQEDWIRLGGGQFIRPENSQSFLAKQRIREEVKREALRKVQDRADALEENKRREALAVALERKERKARQLEALRRANDLRRKEAVERQEEFEASRALQERRARIAVKMKIVERHHRIKEHTAHADEWQPPTPQREFLHRIQETTYNDDSARLFVKAFVEPQAVHQSSTLNHLRLLQLSEPSLAIATTAASRESQLFPDPRESRTHSQDRDASRPSTSSSARVHTPSHKTSSSVLPSLSRSSSIGKNSTAQTPCSDKPVNVAAAAQSRPTTSAEHRARAAEVAAAKAEAEAEARRQNMRLRLHPHVRLALRWVLGRDVWERQASYLDASFMYVCRLSQILRCS
eukprot:INCI15715.2.p1 GENE.INCI15715.2~~INCI15715.2.p1  ORF type:complete len:501 (+),score=116.32 INCI15715.2:326-1828(+)